MKDRFADIFNLLCAALIAYPVFVYAAPPATSPYTTDVTNNFVYDKVTDDMEDLNIFLCLLSATAPNLMVNNGDYIALIDLSTCTGGSSGNNSDGVSYLTAIANSTRASNSMPMVSNMWIEFGGQLITASSSVTQAPTNKVPYGVFRMDLCSEPLSDLSCRYRGFIDANKQGLSFYSANKSTTSLTELALQLTSSSSANTGSGILVKISDATGPVVTTATIFAYSPGYFYRNDGSAEHCFNRSLQYAEVSSSHYGLYDIATGERISHTTGASIEYTDTSNIVHNGYISSYGLSMDVAVPNLATVNRVSYSNGQPVKTPYTVLQAGGKLNKYTTISKKLSDLHKVPLTFYPSVSVAVTGGTITTMASGQSYEIYWDKDANQFKVAGSYSTAYRLEPLAVVGSVDNAAMIAGTAGVGFSVYSTLAGGNVTITPSAFASLASTLSNTTVSTIVYDVVYPQDFVAINAAGGLKCIGDCPTLARINTYNSTGATPYFNPGWGPFTSLINYSYTLNPTTGNLIDLAGSAVVQTTANRITSGKLVTGNDMVLVQAAKTLAGCISPCYSQGDIELVPNIVYYTWESSSYNWDRMSFLLNGVNSAETFYSSLPVSFAVPNTATYGRLAGAAVTLNYNEFGYLWGIPDKCTDITTNADCIFMDNPATVAVEVPTLFANQHWAPEFSIPVSSTEGYVTAEIAQSPITKGSQFLVKPLQNEIRLIEVPVNICAVLGLTKPVAITKLPTYTDFIDPRKPKPVLNPVPSPRIKHGVKLY